MSPSVFIPAAPDWPLYWFARLEIASEKGDVAAAVHAQRELVRLGVHVFYCRHRARGGVQQ